MTGSTVITMQLLQLTISSLHSLFFFCLQVLGKHRSYINCVCFQPDSGEFVASASDDHTCRVWSLQGQEVACLPLGAPGMSVCWHESDPGKVSVQNIHGLLWQFDDFKISQFNPCILLLFLTIFHLSKLELLTQFSASNDKKF